MAIPTERLAGDRVLVTGGTGFIGGHLARTLAPHADVTVLDRDTSGDAVPGNATAVEVDVRDADAVAAATIGVDVVFHQAGMVSVPASVDDPVESHATNATGTLNVLEAAREADAAVVVASSAAVYGRPEYTPIDEGHPLDPTSPYGLDKLAADHYVRLYADLYGLDAVALRYFNVYGPGQTGGDYAGVIDIFRDQASRDADITVEGDGTQTRDFVHVDDVVRANLRAATADASGRSYNVGTGEAVTIRRLAERVRDALDADSDIVHTDPVAGDIDESVADVSRARTELGYEPTVELGEGLTDLVGGGA